VSLDYSFVGMAMTRLKASLLLFTLTGCFHRSPDAAVLAPLVAYLTQDTVDQSHQPVYVVFGDELTANVFKSLRQDSRYRILPTGKPFVCPSDGAQCPHPYQLNVQVNERMGDSAIATLQRIHSDGLGQAIAYRETFLLVRRDRTWRIGRVLYGSVMPML
jgi:hypothetical protein